MKKEFEAPEIEVVEFDVEDITCSAVGGGDIDLGENETEGDLI